MAPSARVGRRLRFADFELDLDGGELRRAGVKVALAEQPLRLLEELAGQVPALVTREELRAHLWGEDTFVDFEQGLNAAMKRLRHALGDSVDEPRFIETVPKRGYRFCAPVTVVTGERDLQPSPAADQDQPSGVHPWWRRPAIVVPPLILASVALLALAILAGRGAPPDQRGSRSSMTPATSGFGPVSIAVLPFTDLSPGRDQEYFADGLVEELMAGFAAAGLQVSARTSSFSFRGRSTPAQEIARQLDVRYVLEGSVRKDGEQLRITTSLIDGQSGRLLQTESYDRLLRELFAVQDEIAGAVTGALLPGLAAAPDRARPRGLMTDAEAHELYMRGRHAWWKRTEASVLLSADLFRQAIARAPQYARAHAGLADAHLILGNFTWLTPVQAYPEAKRAAQEALRLDERLAEAHTALAAVHMHYERDWAAAEREFQRAIALDPRSANAHHWYALFLSYLGRHADAIERAEHAERLDPLAAQIAIDHARVLYVARAYERALKHAEKLIVWEPEFANGYRHLGVFLIGVGRCEDGMTSLRRASDLFGGDSFSDLYLAWGYARCGRADEARLLVSRLLEHRGQRYVEPNRIAHVFVALGEREQAMIWLVRAVAEHAPFVSELAVEPALDPIRSDPRFIHLLTQTGLPAIPLSPSSRPDGPLSGR